MAIKNGDGTVSYEGCVLGWKERNGRDDSDWFALVWDAEKKCARWVEYATTRCAAPWYDPTDATPEVRAEYDAWAEERRAEQAAKDQAMRDADPVKDKTVTVVKGKHKGKTGVVFWRGKNGFRTYYRNGYNKPDAPHNQRIGFLTEDGEKVFTELLNVRVVGHEDVDPGQVKSYFNVMGTPGWSFPY